MAIDAPVPFVAQGSAPPLIDPNNLPLPPDEQPGEFHKGLRRGADDALASGATLAGTTAAAAGKPGWAADADTYAKGRVAAANAPDNAAAVPSMSDIHFGDEGGLRRTGQYLAGKAGEFAPMAAGAIGATALAPEAAGLGGAAAAGTAALAPFTMGESLRRQQADPVASQRTPMEQLASAAQAGIPAAAAQSVPFAGPLGGAVERAGAGMAERVLTKAAVGAGEQGLAGGASEAMQEKGVGGPLDPKAIADAAAGQAVVGGALHGLGGLKANVPEGATAAPGMLSRAADYLQTKLQGDKAAPSDAAAPPAGDPAAPAPVEPPKPFAAPAGAGAGDPDAAAVAAGKAVGDPADLQAAAAGTPASIAKVAQGMADKATGWAQDLLGRKDVAPADAAAVQTAAADPATPANAQLIAAKKVAYDAKDAFVAGVNKLKDLLPDAAKPADDTQQSADYSGTNQLIAQHMADVVPPEVLNDPEALANLGAATRSYIDAARNGDDLVQPTRAVHALLGDAAEGALHNIYTALHPDDSPATQAKFYDTLDAGQQEHGAQQSLQKVVEANLPKDHGLDPAEVTRRLTDWATGNDNGPQKGRAAQFHNSMRIREIQKIFGAGTDKVMDALEKESVRHSLGNRLGDEADFDKSPGQHDDLDYEAQTSGGINDAQTKVQYFGDGSGNKRQSAGFPMDSPTAWHSRFPDSVHQSPAEKLMDKVKGRYPNAHVSFEHDLDGDDPSKGRVKVDHGKPADPTDITPNEFDAARLKAGFDESPYRLDVNTDDGLVKYDAMKLVKQAKLHMPSDGTPTRMRTARAFLKALGQLSLEHGDIEIPPGLKIAKDLTYADLPEAMRVEARKDAEGNNMETGLERRNSTMEQQDADLPGRDSRDPEKAGRRGPEQPGGNVASPPELRSGVGGNPTNDELVGNGTKIVDPSDVRGKFEQADERLRSHELKILHETDPEKRSDMLAKHAKLVERQESAYARMNHEEVATDLGGDEGTAEPSKDGQIHEASNRVSEEDLIQRSNEDTSKHAAPSAEPLSEGDNAGLKRAADVGLKLKGDARPQAKAIGQKIMDLLGTEKEPNAVTLGAKDRKALIDAVTTHDTSSLETAARTNFDGPAGKALGQLRESGAPTGVPKLSDLASVVNRLHADYTARLKLANEAAEPKTTLARKDEVMDKSMADRVAPAREAAEQLKAEKKAAPSGDGGTTRPKAEAAKKAALREAASSSDPELLRQIGESDDAKSLQRTATELNASNTLERARRSGQAAPPELNAKVMEAGSENLKLFRSGADRASIEGVLRERIAGIVKEAMATGSKAVMDETRALLGRLWNAHTQLMVNLPAKEANASIKGLLADGKPHTAADYMNAVVNGKDTPEPLRVVARAVRTVLQAGKRDVPVTRETLGGQMAAWSGGEDRIMVDPKFADRASAVMVHEGVHAATVEGMAQHPEIHEALYALLAHVQREDPMLAGAYGTTNTAEFLSEGLSNAAFQARMKNIKASEEVHTLFGKVKNAWEAFTSLVRQAMGMKPEDHNALTQFLDLAGAAMHSTAKDAPERGDPIGRMATAKLDGITKEYTALVQSLLARPDAAPLHGILKSEASLLEHGKMPTYLELRALEEYEAATNGGFLPSHVTDADLDETQNNLIGMNQFLANDVRPPSPTERAIDTANAKIAEAVKDPATAYSLQRQGGAGTVPKRGAAGNSPIHDYIKNVLGPSVARELNKALAHAGEYVKSHLDPNGQLVKGIIRVSVHALDPMGVAYHESMHALMQQLREGGFKDMAVTLEKAGSSAAVMRQLQAHFHDQPDVLRQIRNDPEERAAYMYQLAQAGQLRLGDGAKGVFATVGDWIKKSLGIWTNDERAQHIMDYFSSGEYAKNIGDRNALTKALAEPGQNAAVNRLVELVKPLTRLGEAAFSTGQGRLRDSGIPALRKLADLVKVATTGEGEDHGYIPAARMARTQFLNKLGERLAPYDNDQLHDALHSMQTQTLSQDPKVRAAATTIMGHLREVFDYMGKAGVNVRADRGPSYFPRVWDTEYISRHQTEFLDMLRKYKASGELTGDPLDVLHTLTANDGNDFAVDTRRPGMQMMKERKLDFIKDEDFSKFGEKDLYKTMNSYIGQATRRAEWARRFGEHSQKVDEMFGQAQKEGASTEDISTAENYLRGVNGTLGDTINPTLRRLMGNMIVYQNIRLLPLAIFSSMPDAAGIFVRGGTLGEAFGAFKRGLSELPNAFKKDGGQRDWQTRMAEEIGTIDNASLGHALGSLYTQGMVGGGMQKLNDNFFRFNFMEGYNQSMRVAATQAAMNFIKRHATVDSTHSTRWLAELGLQKSDVRVAADGSINYQDPKVRMAVNKWVDGAVLRPDAADKPIWMNDPRFALIAHLKQFTYAFQKTILSRVAHEASHGNYMPAAGLAAYVPIMIAADLLKGMIQGGGAQPSWKKDWGLADYIGDGVQRGGLLGVGQTGVDMYNGYHRGGGAIGAGLALTGPTVDQMVEGVKTLAGREQYGTFALHALPANQLYTGYIKGASAEDPTFAE